MKFEKGIKTLREKAVSSSERSRNIDRMIPVGALLSKLLKKSLVSELMRIK